MNVKDLLVSAAGTQYLLSTQYTQDEYYTGDLVDFSNKLPEKDSTQQQQQPQRQKAKREDNPNEEQPAAKKARVSYQACPTCKKFHPPLADMQRRLRISLVCMRNWLNQLGLAEEEV